MPSEVRVGGCRVVRELRQQARGSWCRNAHACAFRYTERSAASASFPGFQLAVHGHTANLNRAKNSAIMR
jgi:hypothetical protein